IDYAGVLARAEVLARAGAGDADADPAGADPSAAAAALAEARDVTERLRCRPLLERADEAAQALSLAGSRS
ncbi:MAG: hypothetical protein ACRDZ5_11435, partial [Acidimicrobiales bacterium]